MKTNKTNPTKKPKAGMSAQAGRRVVKAWAVIDAQTNYVWEINMHRSILIKSRNSYFSHNPKIYNLKKLRTEFPIVTISFSLPSKGSAKKKRG